MKNEKILSRELGNRLFFTYCENINFWVAKEAQTPPIQTLIDFS